MGFVWHVCRVRTTHRSICPGRNPDIGFVCTTGPGPLGQSPEIGFVSHNHSLSRLLTTGYRLLALFFRGPWRYQLASTPYPLSTCAASCSVGNWVCLARKLRRQGPGGSGRAPPTDPRNPIAGGIGFVSHGGSSHFKPETSDFTLADNWLCFAPSVPQPTTGYRPAPFGFVSHIASPTVRRSPNGRGRNKHK